MTNPKLQQVKDACAKEKGYEKFVHYLINNNIEEVLDEVAERYAASKLMSNDNPELVLLHEAETQANKVINGRSNPEDFKQFALGYMAGAASKWVSDGSLPDTNRDLIFIDQRGKMHAGQFHTFRAIRNCFANNTGGIFPVNQVTHWQYIELHNKM